MTYLILKATVSGLLVMLVSEAAKRSPNVGGLLASLPLISVLAAVWLWRDTGDEGRIASLLEATFWYVLPTLPMFFVMPLMLRSGLGFWLSLGIALAMTMTRYVITAWGLSKVGIRL